MKEDHKISIITPSFNSEAFISKTIESVLQQSYTNWEMLIVDDASGDNSVPTIEQYSKEDPRIKLFSLKNNAGPAAARNYALKQAEGSYIAFLDSDDMWYPKKLETQYNFMKEHDIAFSFHEYEVILQTSDKVLKTISVPSKLNYHQYLRNTIIGCLTVMIDKTQTGEFRMPLIRSSHDMALWLDILKRGFNAYGVPQILAQYRLVPTSNTAKKITAARDVWKVYREIEHLGLLYSLFNFVGYSINAILKRI